MSLCDETIKFLIFVGVGIIFSIIYDFFRALRKIKRRNNLVVLFQDILYFIIIGIVLLVVVLNINGDSFRLYTIIGMVLGIVIYISIVGNKIMKLFYYMLKGSNAFIEFIFLPVKVYLVLFNKQVRKIKKYVIICCKKISYMIEFYHKKVKLVFSKSNNKRGKKYDKIRESKC